MLVPVPVNVGASAGDQYVDFRCSRCGAVAQATVSSLGMGLSVVGESLSSAAADARVGAARAVQLAPCPRCGRRSRGALAKVLVLGSVVGLLAGFAGGLVATEQLRRADPGGTVGEVIGVAIFLAVVGATAAIKLRRARQQVRFHDSGS